MDISSCKSAFNMGYTAEIEQFLDLSNEWCSRFARDLSSIVKTLKYDSIDIICIMHIIDNTVCDFSYVKSQTVNILAIWFTNAGFPRIFMVTFLLQLTCSYNKALLHC